MVQGRLFLYHIPMPRTQYGLMGSDPGQIPDWLELKSVGEGWVPLLEELHKDLLDIYPDYTVAQIKEKFGGLRCYLNPLPHNVFERMHEKVDEAEAKSQKLCEECGNPGSLRTRKAKQKFVWCLTLCDNHAKQRHYID